MNLVLLAFLISLTVKYKGLKKTFRAYKKALRNIGKTINSVRYGNIHERIDKISHSIVPNFSQSVDRMIESIVDREKMILEYQADLNKQIEIQKEIEKIKEDFVATLTHDLKVPIIAESNMLNFLMENRFGELSEKQKEAVSHIKNSNKELIELVEILLETYKLNETDINLSIEPVDIHRLFEKILSEMDPIAQTHSININYNADFHGQIAIDEFYMKRVLKNIILNAISFSNPNSQIDVYVHCCDESLIMKIKNYGKTIKKEHIEHIFDKYYSTTNKFRKVGTGLGLYLSNKIVKAHNGTIDAVSDNEENTVTMVISLPLK